MTDLLSMIGNILSGRPAFSQAHDFSEGQRSNANLQWPSLASIGPLQAHYVDAGYPDINAVPYRYSGASISREQALNNTLPFQSYRVQQVVPDISAKVDHAGNNNGGDDAGYYYNNNPYAPQQAPLASFSRMSI